MSSKPSSMRELHRLARERLGARAATLKTRDELLAALDAAGEVLAPATAAAPEPPRAPRPVAPALPVVAPPNSALVTQDFFVDPQGK